MTADFSISEVAIADASPAGGPVAPSPPDVFPSTTLTNRNVKVRFFEPNAATAINARWMGMPRGVYLGYEPSVTAGSNVLTLNVDSGQNFSLLKVPSKRANVMVDIFTASAVTLDFTGHVTFPVYVLADATYVDGRSSFGRIFTRAAGTVSAEEVLICEVSKVGDDLSVTTTAPTSRQTPVAFTGQSYGFMPSGSKEDLDDTVPDTGEVTAARLSPYTAPTGGTPGVDPFDSLSERIAADHTSEATADRLFLRHVNILSNAHSVSGTSANVSRSFSGVDREVGPFLTLEPSGSESDEGVITAPDDTDRNVCFVVNEDTGERLIDSNGEPLHGRLSYTNGTVGATAEILFSNASTNVTGTNSPFAAINVGDIILGGDGNYYEVDSITDPDTATIGSAYQGPTTIVLDAAYRRFTLTFQTSSDAQATLLTTNIRFAVPGFFRVDRAIYDAALYLRQHGEPPDAPLATQTVQGKGLLATSDGKVGSVRTIQNANAFLGNDFHTLNFVNGGVSPSPGRPGVVDIAVTGPQGPPGPPQDVGPPGPSGPVGDGLAQLVPFIDTAFLPISGPVSLSHDFSTNGLSAITHLWGGISAYDGIRSFWEQHITTFTASGPTTGTITVTMTADGPSYPDLGARVKVYLGAAE